MVKFLLQEGIREIDEGDEQLSGLELIGTALICAGAIGGALWGMKKISERERGEKLSWTEFLIPER